jgi:L-2,4-diaminobutyric acid acetyltransferase
LRGELTLRGPDVADAARIWSALPRMGALERNTAYAYLLLCSHFGATGIVAERGPDLVGFVLGYRPPTDPDALFVWQVGVVPEARGQGLASRMLDALVARPGNRSARWLTATVSSDNTASLALFRGFARHRGAVCQQRRCFESSLFPEPHPGEDLLRIGPLGADRLATKEPA